MRPWLTTDDLKAMQTFEATEFLQKQLDREILKALKRHARHVRDREIARTRVRQVAALLNLAVANGENCSSH